MRGGSYLYSPSCYAPVTTSSLLRSWLHETAGPAYAMGCGASQVAPLNPEPGPAKQLEHQTCCSGSGAAPISAPLSLPLPPLATGAASNPLLASRSSSSSVAGPSEQPKSSVLSARLPTEELVWLCQSSHFDRTQVAIAPARLCLLRLACAGLERGGARACMGSEVGAIQAHACLRLRLRQVEKLYELFKVISSSGNDDGKNPCVGGGGCGMVACGLSAGGVSAARSASPWPYRLQGLLISPSSRRRWD